MGSPAWLQDAEVRDGLEEACLAELAKSDPRAFGELYRRNVDRVFHYLLTYCDTVEDAADLTQHAFLRAFEALPSYRARGSTFSAWLFRIARNLAIDTYRQRRAVLPWDHLPADGQPLTFDDPETVSLRRERLNQLRLLVAQLCTEKQDLLYLRFSAELTAGDIATVVGKSEAAVQKQLTRIINLLKDRYRAAEI